MFCPNCGRECLELNYCPQCGQKLTDGAVSVLNTKPEPGTEAFETKRAELTRRQIPHCPKCLSTHITAMHVTRYSLFYDTRFVCLWCQYEWGSEGKEKHKKKGLGKTK